MATKYPIKVKAWSKDEEKHLMDNYGAAGVTAAQIGETLGRSEGSVRWKASELGLTGLNRVTRTAFYSNTDAAALDLPKSNKPWWKFW